MRAKGVLMMSLSTEEHALLREWLRTAGATCLETFGIRNELYDFDHTYMRAEIALFSYLEEINYLVLGGSDVVNEGHCRSREPTIVNALLRLLQCDDFAHRDSNC